MKTFIGLLAVDGHALGVVERLDGGKGFKVLSKRWIAGRTFAGLGKDGLRAKDRHQSPCYAETAICAISTLLMPRMLAKI